MTNAVIYLRISSDPTGQEAGVTRQREDCLKLAELRGWTVPDGAIYVDNDISAYTGARRDGFDGAIAAVEHGGIGAVIAWDLTRLTRNARDRVRLLDACVPRKTTIALVRGAEIDPSTPTGSMMIGVLGEISSFESAQKADRQRRAIRQAVEQGRRVGGRRPFGYEADGRTIRPREAAAIEAAYGSLLAGVPLAVIARTWNEHGLRTGQISRKTGEPGLWTHDTVRGVLVNPRYAGLRGHGSVPEHGRRKVEAQHRAQWPAVVPEETWRAAVEHLSDPSRRTAPRSGRALLTGLGLCGVCGSPVHGGRTVDNVRTYRCSAAYGHVSRSAEPVDAWVAEVVVARLSRPDAADLLVATDAPDAEAMSARAMALRSRLGNLADLLADGTLTADAVRSASARLKAELAEVESKMTDAGRVDVLGPLVGSADVAAAWGALGVDRQRAVVATLAIVRVQPPGRGTRTFRPESVVIEPRV